MKITAVRKSAFWLVVQILIFLVCCDGAKSFEISSRHKTLFAHPTATASSSSTVLSMAQGSTKISGLRAQPPRPNECTYWVTNNLIAGEYPTKSRFGRTQSEEQEAAARKRIQNYLDCGITYFIDLTQEGEKAPYEQILKDEATKRGMAWGYRRLPIRDFGIPTSKDEMTTILDEIDQAIAENHKVYVHCRGGIGRTGTTVGCYLGRHGNTGSEALDEVNRLFQNSDRSYESSYSPETRDQMDFVLNWND